jgi:hypothetical protein
MDHKKSKLKHYLGYIPRTIRKADVYGQEVKLTLKGNEKFKTTIGGFWTIMLMLSIIVYGGFQTDMMFKYGDTNISIKNLLKDRTNDREIHIPYPDIQLSFIVEKDGVDLIQLGGYVQITVNQVEQTYERNPSTGVKERARTKKSLDFEK